MMELERLLVLVVVPEVLVVALVDVVQQDLSPGLTIPGQGRDHMSST